MVVPFYDNDQLNAEQTPFLDLPCDSCETFADDVNFINVGVRAKEIE